MVRAGYAPDNGDASMVGPGSASVCVGLTVFMQYEFVSAAPAYIRKMLDQIYMSL